MHGEHMWCKQTGVKEMKRNRFGTVEKIQEVIVRGLQECLGRRVWTTL